MQFVSAYTYYFHFISSFIHFVFYLCPQQCCDLFSEHLSAPKAPATLFLTLFGFDLGLTITIFIVFIFSSSFQYYYSHTTLPLTYHTRHSLFSPSTTAVWTASRIGAIFIIECFNFIKLCLNI